MGPGIALSLWLLAESLNTDDAVGRLLNEAELPGDLAKS